MKITAIIPTFNEAQHIADAIKTVQWADEILVVDSHSTDDTVTIARNLGITVLQHTFETHARQKNWAIAQARHAWVFILDADERVTPALAQEINTIKQKPEPGIQGYWLRRNNYFMGQKVRYSGWQVDKVLRLFNKTHCHYPDQLVHEEIACSGSVGTLNNRLEHYTYRGLQQYMQKFDSYTWLGAKGALANHVPVTAYHLTVKPFVRFLKHYFYMFGFLDGRVGFVISYLSAHSVFMRYLKLWRLQQGEHA